MLLVARAPVAEVVTLQDVGLLEQAHRPVDGRDADGGIQRAGPAVQLLDIGMIGRLGEHAGDDAALGRHLQPFLGAELLDSIGHGYPAITILI